MSCISAGGCKGRCCPRLARDPLRLYGGEARGRPLGGDPEKKEAACEAKEGKGAAMNLAEPILVELGKGSCISRSVPFPSAASLARELTRPLQPLPEL